jgi:rhodanese-related sulfurtransferase
MVARDGGAEGADRYLVHGDRVGFGKRYLTVRATPGHTAGCLTYILDDESRAFTGDCLLIRSAGRTDFQQGSAAALYRSVHTQIFSLPAACLLYPAHDYRGLTVTSVAEERQFNPRLGGELSEQDFAGYMANLGLPHPKKIDVAVPANLRCGQPPDALDASREPDWAPLNYTFAGVWEVEPHWVEEHLGEVQVLDVREPQEYAGPLGHIPGATLVPLGQLGARVKELAKERPIVAVCRAGGRSARATAILKSAGFANVANLAGGMLRWRAQHHAVEGGAD